MMNRKLIVIAGPTAVGKTGLSIRLAKKFSGEVISADSRQVYRELNIGTEKITKREMQGIRHHLLDVASPRRAFSAARFKTLSEKAIKDIRKRGNVPLLVGGTGFYIDAVVYGHELPSVLPNAPLRAQLEKKSAGELFKTLKKLDPKRAKTIEEKNKRRLIRAIEIARTLGSVPPLSYSSILEYDVLYLGLTLPDTVLKKRIDNRLIQAVRKGLVAETKKLRENDVSWKRVNELGLEYRTSGAYIRGEITKKEMIEKMQREIWNYAKRQIRWFKRNKHIEWYSPKEVKKIGKRVTEFLNS